MHDRMTLDEFAGMIGIDSADKSATLRKRRPVVGIIGPFRGHSKDPKKCAAEVRANVRRAYRWMLYATKLGARVFCPHTMYGDLSGVVDEAEMVEITKEWVTSWDAGLVIVSQGSAEYARSDGSLGEVIACGAHGIPAFWADEGNGGRSWDFEAWIGQWQKPNGQQPAAQTTAGDDPVNHPNHYTAHFGGAEVIDLIEWLPFNFGAVVKYICRAEHKGKREEDLKKGIHFYARELNRLGIDFSDVDLTWGRKTRG